MVTISLCMIVKNEEEVLARCLGAVRTLVDEIILVDTGSTDKTKEIAREFTDKIYDFEWIEDFSAARNFSFSKAAMDYCMWLDADDVFTEANQQMFLALKASLEPDTDVVMLQYHTATDADGVPTFSYYRERLLRRACGFEWQGAVHEAIAPRGKIIYRDVAVTHAKLHAGDSDRNLRIYEKQLASGKILAPRDQFYFARELTYHGRDLEAVQILCAFLDDRQGWVENSIEGARLLSQCCARLAITGEAREEDALRALLRSLEFDTPRAELCCDIGAYFFERQDWRQADFWYTLATSCKRDDTSGGFVLPDCYDYIPYLQLCVCHFRLGDREKAIEYNEKAGVCKPNGSAYLFNKKFFERGD